MIDERTTICKAQIKREPTAGKQHCNRRAACHDFKGIL